jgi:UDP-glucose 4-epimerase
LIILAAEHPECIDQTFNIPGEDFSLREAAGLIAARLGVGIESVEWPEFDLRIESGSTVFDGSRLLGALRTSQSHKLSDWALEIA